MITNDYLIVKKQIAYKRIRSIIKNLNYEINDKNIKLLRNEIIITDTEDNNNKR